MPSAPTTADLRSLIEHELKPLTALRRSIHREPELCFKEHKTSARIASELTALRIERIDGVGAEQPGKRGTGVIGYLPATEGPADRPSIGLRADIDALPIQEETGAEHASSIPGVMHACGHDGHTAILLGAARVLSKIDHRPNAVTFVFQPAEEGGGGAEKLIRDGVLGGEGAGPAGIGRPVGRMFGLHGWPEVPVGTVSTKPGALLAATDDFLVTIRGEGGHAAYPHLGRDPVVAASAVVQAIQSIASRNTDPVDSVVITVGRIVGGSANNVIPDSVQLEGTIRTLRDDSREMACRRFVEVVEHAARALGCSADIEMHRGYPVTNNDSDATEHFFGVAREAFGDQHVGLVPAPGLGGEDFSYYGREVPACFFLLGLLPEGADPKAAPKLHQPTFDFNDDAIVTGVEAMCRLALSEY
ncbi:MAG: M20 family metallopeptidase [Planctomycetota bacterium]